MKRLAPIALAAASVLVLGPTGAALADDGGSADGSTPTDSSSTQPTDEPTEDTPSEEPAPEPEPSAEPTPEPEPSAEPTPEPEPSAEPVEEEPTVEPEPEVEAPVDETDEGTQPNDGEDTGGGYPPGDSDGTPDTEEPPVDETPDTEPETPPVVTEPETQTPPIVAPLPKKSLVWWAVPGGDRNNSFAEDQVLDKADAPLDYRPVQQCTPTLFQVDHYTIEQQDQQGYDDLISGGTLSGPEQDSFLSPSPGAPDGSYYFTNAAKDCTTPPVTPPTTPEQPPVPEEPETPVTPPVDFPAEPTVGPPAITLTAEGVETSTPVRTNRVASSSDLPNTGGPETLPLLLAGSALVIGGGALALRRRREVN